MADVFISYSKSHVELTRELAKELEAKGLTVWWDTDLLAGELFRHRIIQEIKACKAAIVIWTRESVHSDYVLSEAERARVAGKLIQLRTADLDPSELPPPFDTSHASLTEDRKAIYGALAKLGVLRNDSTVVSGPLPRFREDSRRALWTPSVGKLVAAALATLMVIGALATTILFRADRPPPIRDMEGRAAMVANQFFDELNAGLPELEPFQCRRKTWPARAHEQGRCGRRTSQALGQVPQNQLPHGRQQPDAQDTRIRTKRIPRQGVRRL